MDDIWCVFIILVSLVSIIPLALGITLLTGWFIEKLFG